MNKVALLILHTRLHGEPALQLINWASAVSGTRLGVRLLQSLPQLPIPILVYTHTIVCKDAESMNHAQIDNVPNG